MTQQLLSNNWANSYLNNGFNTSLMFLRRSRLKISTQEFKEGEYFRETPIFLSDNPKLEQYHTDVLIVTSMENQKQKDMIFIFKHGLVNELNKYQLPERLDVDEKMTEYVEKIGLNAMNMENTNVRISQELFIELLKNAHLEHLIDSLGLVSKKITKNNL